MKGLTQKLRGQSISLAVALVALVLSTTGAAVAGSIITGKQIKNGSITSADIKQGNVRSGDIGRNQVRSTDIAAGQVKSADIGAGQVAAADIGRDQVKAAAIGDDQVTAAAIAPNQVGTEQIAPDAVGTAEVAPGAVGSTEIANGSVTPQDVTMPGPVQFQRPAGEPASVNISSPDYTLVAVMGTYEKQDATSALEASWTGTAEADPDSNSDCVFQVRVDGQASRGAGEVYVSHGPAISVSATSLFDGLGTGPHQVEIWARLTNYGGGTFTCTVGPFGTGIAQTVVVSEKVV